MKEYPVSYITNKRRHYNQGVRDIESKTAIQLEKLMLLENSVLMYSIYNAEMMEKLINTVHNIHNTTSLHEILFTGQESSLTLRSLYANSLGLHHYSLNLLYLRTVQDKYIALYRELITELHIYASAIRMLAKDTSNFTNDSFKIERYSQ